MTRYDLELNVWIEVGVGSVTTQVTPNSAMVEVTTGPIATLPVGDVPASFMMSNEKLHYLPAPLGGESWYVRARNQATTFVFSLS